MAESISDLQRKMKALQIHEKAVKAAERGSIEVALTLSRQALSLAPHEKDIRRQFHETRIRAFRAAKKGGLGLKMAEMGANMKTSKAQNLLKQNKPDEAMLLAEEIMDVNPLNPAFNDFYFDIAQRAGYPEAQLAAMETLANACPTDRAIMERLGDIYVKNEVFDRASECYRKATALNPSDLNLQRKLKDAMAKNTMTAGGWEENAGKAGGFQKLIRDQELAKKLDRESKAQIVGDDAEIAIRDAKAKIAKEPKNINYYRALARIYIQNKRFDEALETFDAARKVNPSDPELDRNWSDTKIKSYDLKIEQLRAEGKTEEAEEMEVEQAQFAFDDLVRRVENYPNDLGLRYELGVMYYTYEAYDDAVQQFQLAQRSPKHRLWALYYLACSFKQKGQSDMAVMQLEAAASQLQVMDDLKKHVIYTLGQIAEEKGDIEAAFNYYKDVYAADIGFEDIDACMQRVHAQRG